MTGERIPFKIEVQRVIEVLATQIYQSPLALLRENTQNAFDAICQRQFLGDNFAPQISVEVTSQRVVVIDNGIGMTGSDLRKHFWSAGSSSKNTPEARAAGVVGTFGIGAMANFGVADQIEVITESAITQERTRSVARRDTLSLTEDCILIEPMDSTASPGTTVVAEIAQSSLINVQEAEDYLKEFISFVSVPVFLNGAHVSQNDLSQTITFESRSPAAAISGAKMGDLVGDVSIGIAHSTGEVFISITNMLLGGFASAGRIDLRQGLSRIRSYRNGFGLAVFSLSSAYQFGGAVDLAILEPTAGREALSTGSMQLLQNAMSAIDRIVSEAIADTSESDLNSCFMTWVQTHRRYELCENLKMRVEPNRDRTPLSVVRAASIIQPLRVYSGTEPTVIEALASEDAELYVVAANNPRRQCELEFLNQFCQVNFITDAPLVLSTKEFKEWSLEEQALVYRIVGLLESDYFLSIDIKLGEITHGLPVLFQQGEPGHLVLDPGASTFGLLVTLYDSDYAGFASMVKDFVRTIIFPQVSSLVPSSTRQGAESFLRSIKRTRDIFEYEYDDWDDMKSIWSEILNGKITLGEAASKASTTSSRVSQVLDSGSALPFVDVVPDIIRNDELLKSFESLDDEPVPAITRVEVETVAKLLTISPGADSLKGYRCFLAISDKAREERGDFFLQPHRTSIIWGGQRVLFVFEHHSRTFGLYYDLQTSGVVSAQSGGGPFPTSTIVLGNRIFIPIPDSIASSFLPLPTEKKRFGVKCDLIFSDEAETATES